ncbi:response regulator transcription factor [Bifidobacterium simiiventris]|uniref:response regulator transcription factor n=1 Tax=Bifidobacterium simiiventris TaxID=2834434 RepID=UPI001C56E87F|nr:response regulator transcription factor [Bifidobacterium simiiventris]MBW3079530.1 response regulator transcription factor [Bifidobacterium simiiventris]
MADPEHQTNRETSRETIRVAIVDNDPYALFGLAAQVKACGPRFEVVWQSELGAVAFQKALDPRTTPDVMLVDMSLTDMQGPDLCAQIRLRSRSIGLVGITSRPLEQYCDPMIEAGAQGLVGKRISPQSLAQVLIQAAAGQPVIPEERCPEAATSRTFQSVAESFARVNAGRTRGTTLSEHEREALTLYASGLKTAQVAAHMSITVSSVQTLVNRAKTKLGAASLPQAIRICTERQLLAGPRNESPSPNGLRESSPETSSR